MPVDPVNSALSQRPAPARAPARVALALGLAGALGEELLALLIASSAYRQVVVGVTQPLGSATARFSPWVVGHGYPIVDEAWICVTGDETFVPSASPMYRVDEAGLLEAAAVAKSCGAARLTVVAPLAALLQLGAGAQSVSSASEIALVEMGFNPLVIVRPTAADADEPGASLPHRIVRSAARAVADIMLPQYARALSAKSAARAIIEANAAVPRGVTVVSARALLKLTEARFPLLRPKRKGNLR